MPKYLGKSDSYIKNIDNISLEIIQRESNTTNALTGWDYWNAYEFMHLQDEEPVLACLEIKIPHSSKFIIESKSMKLFLNTFFDQEFQANDVTAHLSKTFSEVLDANVDVKAIEQYQSLPIFKPLNKNTGKLISGSIYRFQGYRSLCPVTSQPDFANLFFYSENFNDLDSHNLLSIIKNHMNTQAFHEACIESITDEILENHEIDLQVFGRFLRRGGIDINPLRCYKTANPIFENFREFNQ
ncbi:MAG: 7-cyano-7-deazaguanine reductase [Gammaproteobacteria bacterium]